MPRLAGRDPVQSMSFKQLRSVYAPQMQNLVYDRLDKLAKYGREFLCQIRHRKRIAASGVPTARMPRLLQAYAVNGCSDGSDNTIEADKKGGADWRPRALPFWDLSQRRQGGYRTCTPRKKATVHCNLLQPKGELGLLLHFFVAKSLQIYTAGRCDVKPFDIFQDAATTLQTDRPQIRPKYSECLRIAPALPSPQLFNWLHLQ